METSPIPNRSCRRLAALLALALGLTAAVRPAGAQLWALRSAIYAEGNMFLLEPALNDEFADTLAVGDFDASGHGDLAIGAPRESVVAGGDGAEWVLYGALFADGFESGSAGVWSAAVP